MACFWGLSFSPVWAVLCVPLADCLRANSPFRFLWPMAGKWLRRRSKSERARPAVSSWTSAPPWQVQSSPRLRVDVKGDTFTAEGEDSRLVFPSGDFIVFCEEVGAGGLCCGCVYFSSALVRDLSSSAGNETSAARVSRLDGFPI